MATITHTPGPWKIVDYGTQQKYIEGGDREIGKAWLIEDARLIAAAPDLLHALRELLRDVDEAEEIGQGTYTAARAAIAKAEGRP